MFDFLKKKIQYESLNIENNKITSLGNGQLIPIENVKDEMFAQKMLGDSIFHQYSYHL